MTYNPEPEIQHYLERLSKAARGLPRARRRELVAEIEQHIRDTLIESPVDNEAEMLTLLDRVGDPDEIAVAAIGKPEVRRSTTMETWAIILLLLGGFLWFIGWIAGVILLWSSSLWTRRDKLIGTFVIPGGLATGVTLMLFSAMASGGACSVAPVYPSPLNRGQATRATYSQAIRYAQHGRLRDVVFQPTMQEIAATFRGKTIVFNYPTDQSAVEFQNLLQRHSIAFRSVGAVGESCTGGASTIEGIGIVLALAVCLVGPIATSIYLGRRLNKEKSTRAAAT